MHFSHNVKGLFEGEDLVLQLGPGLGLKSDLEATSGEAWWKLWLLCKLWKSYFCQSRTKQEMNPSHRRCGWWNAGKTGVKQVAEWVRLPLSVAEPDWCNKYETQFITMATVAMCQNLLLGTKTTEKVANKSCDMTMQRSFYKWTKVLNKWTYICLLNSWKHTYITAAAWI